MTNDNFIELKRLLKNASSEDRSNLKRIIHAKYGDSPRLLCDHLHYLHAGTFSQHWNRDTYKQLVTNVADHLKIDWTSLLRGRHWLDLSSAEIENAIVVTALQNILRRLPDGDRRRLAEELGKEANDLNLVSELVSGGAIVLARLSGFQIYLLATTTVGALTGALGISLPFAFYAAMTTGLGIALGPIGWSVLGISVLLSLNQSNWSRIVPGVVYISYIRHKLEENTERDVKSDALPGSSMQV